jgi:peptidoglycan/LPS O-acetylase OafA/YrhL
LTNERFPLTGRRLEELDSLRGAAALVVVFHHTLMVLPRFSDFTAGRTRPHGLGEMLMFQTPLALLWAGHAAVLLFFTLSGFVLALPWLNGRAPTYPVFAVRRIFRIWAPYMAVVGAVMLMLLTVRFPPLHGLSSWLNKSWNHPVTWDVLVQHILMTGEDDFVDNPVWSLDWEMRISAVFPLLMLPLVRWRAAGGLAAGGLLLVAYFGFELVLKRPGQGDPVFLLYTLGFVVGAILAACQDQIRTLLAKPWASLGLAAAAAVTLSRTPPFAWQDTPGELIMLAGAVALICAAIAPGPLHRALLRPALKSLGRISYSLYLVHVPVILLAAHLLHGRAPVWAVMAIGVAGALALATGVNRLVEESFDRLGRRLAGRLPVPAGSAKRAVAAPAPTWAAASEDRDAA